MTWFRVDDTLAAHPKARAAGLPALGLWVVSGSWSSQQLTEGFVPTWFVETWPRGRKMAAALVAAGLWVESENGWQFHDWTDCNPTAESERARRKAAAERQKRAREKAAALRDAERDTAVENMHTDTRESRDTSRVTNAASHAPPYPTLPDPALTTPLSFEGGSHVSSGSPTAPPRFPDHCPEHADVAVPGNCGDCKDTREANAWAAEQLPDYRLRVVPDLCGQCDERWIETPQGLAKCPRCYPAEVAS